MANVQITQLPAAGPITGTESVPIVQNGVTVQTTTGAIAASPSQTQTFLTKDQELTLPNSRYLSTGTGLGLTDGGALSFYRISLNGTSGSLESAAGGIIVKNSGSTVIARSIATSGAGLSVSNADGTSGNPTLSLSGVASALAGISGTGLVVVQGGSTAGQVQIVGTTNQISVANGNGVGNPTISLASNPVLPGTGAVTVPIGTNAQQPAGTNGQVRYNTDTSGFEGFSGGSWKPFKQTGDVLTFSAGSTGLTPATPATGNVVLGGTLNVFNGGTGVSSLTGYVRGNGGAPMSAVSTVPAADISGTLTNAQIANPQVTINGVTVALGGSGTIATAAPNSLTFGTGMISGTYNGSLAETISLATTGVGAGSYGASNKTLTATVNAQGQLTALAETNIAINTSQVTGLGTMATQNSTNVSITGGNINGTVIGGTTPAAGTFTSVAMTSGTITTTPTSGNDIVNKTYVDTISAAGITYHAPVKYEAPNPLTATYNNGAAGVGATLTNAGTLAAFAPDGPTAQVGDRILIYQQANQVQNGVYTVTTVGDGSTAWVLTRATDANTYGAKNPNALGEGDAFFVTSGNTGAGETYVCNTSGTITFGTTAITFAQVSDAQIYSAGTGLTLSGTQFSISNTGVSASSYGTASSVPTLAINAQGQVTGASNTPIAINANQITSGSVTNAQLQNSSLTINGTSVSLGGSATVTATASNALTIGGGLTGTSYNGSAPVTIALSNSGVAANTYGSGSQVPVFAVDSYGRVTSVTNTSIAISSGAVSGLAASATTDTTNATNITSGTLPTSRLSGSYTGITGVGTITAGTWNGSTIGIGYGGTGVTGTPTNGQLLIGNGSGFSLATLTAGSNITIQNTPGGIQIAASGGGGGGSGTVTSVDVSGGTTGLTTSGGPVTLSGTITLAGTLVVSNGGTGATTLTGYVKGNGTSAMTASSTIPSSDITGLGSMATQNANSVTITGGAIDGTPIGATTASTVRGTTITATTQFSGPGTGLTGTASSLSIGGSASSATTAGTASNLSGGTAGALAYNSGAGTTTFLSLGTSGHVLTAGASAPQYVAPSTLSVGSATTATTATNVAGGAANQIHYQTGSGTTSFITAPTTSSTFLQWNGSAFTWAAAGGGSGTVTSVDVSGGTTGLTFSGGPITTSGTISMGGTLAIANGGTNGTATPTSGAIAYGTGTAYAFSSAGTSGQVLTSTGAGAPSWTSQGSLAVGTATNVSGGSAGAIAYNSAASTTTFLSLGTNGFILTAGATAPQYSNPATLTVGTATNATNATNTAITANSTNATNYLTFVSATTGNLGQLVNSAITCNPSTGALTGGLDGGVF